MKRLQARSRFSPAARILDPLVIGHVPTPRPAPDTIPDVTGKRPDSELDGADLPGLAVRAGSVRGEAHRRRGTPRQDAMGMWQIDGSRLLACVAGGAGGGELSHVGSAEACSAAYGNLADLLDHVEHGTPPAYFFEDVADDLHRRAERDRVSVDTLRTTLLASVIDIGARRAHVTRVGDGTAMLLRRGRWTPCFAEGPDAPAPGTLPRDADRAQTATVDLQQGDMLLLCTGGLARPMRGEQVSDQMSAWWAQPAAPSLPEFYWQLSFRAESHDGDRTAICGWML
ncbi:protein phosphatase 2C domain-containing protein [Streptosporangium sp. NPDC004631]